MKDAVRLYLNPPDEALVLCVDENSQIQALIAPNRGRYEEGAHREDDPRLQTLWHHDVVRGTQYLDGPVTGTCIARHRHRELRRFLKVVV